MKESFLRQMSPRINISTKSQKTKNLTFIFLIFEVDKLFKRKWAKYIKVVIANKFIHN